MGVKSGWKFKLIFVSNLKKKKKNCIVGGLSISKNVVRLLRDFQGLKFILDNPPPWFSFNEFCYGFVSI